MQTLTIGRTKYKLSPSRNVGELTAKVSKITGKTKKTAIAKERRSYPVFTAGQSTAEYVAAFYKMNFYRRDGGGAVISRFFEPLNSEPCTLYSGEDLHETLTDAPENCAPESAAVAQEAAPVDPAPAVDVPAPVEVAVPVAADPSIIRSAWNDATPATKARQARRNPCRYGLFDSRGAMVTWSSTIRGRNKLRQQAEDYADRPYAPYSVHKVMRAECDAWDDSRAPVVTPLPRVLYSEFIRSAGRRETTMTV